MLELRNISGPQTGTPLPVDIATIEIIFTAKTTLGPLPVTANFSLTTHGTSGKRAVSQPV